MLRSVAQRSRSEELLRSVAQKCGSEVWVRCVCVEMSLGFVAQERCSVVAYMCVQKCRLNSSLSFPKKPLRSMRPGSSLDASTNQRCCSGANFEVPLVSVFRSVAHAVAQRCRASSCSEAPLSVLTTFASKNWSNCWSEAQKCCSKHGSSWTTLLLELMNCALSRPSFAFWFVASIRLGPFLVTGSKSFTFYFCTFLGKSNEVKTHGVKQALPFGRLLFPCTG